MDTLLEQMARAKRSRRTYLIAAATLEAFGEKEKAEVWRQRAEAPGLRALAP